MLLKLLLLLIGVCVQIESTTDTGEKSLQGKRIVVTGAAQGIGYAIAYNFLEAGAKQIIILDKQTTKGAEAAAKLNTIFGPNKAVFIYCDVTKHLEPISKKLIHDYDYLDVLVNNAGLINEDIPEIAINTNTLAVIKWSLKFWEYMRADKLGKGGTIINVSSFIANTIQPFLPVYTASKFASLGFSRTLGHEHTYNYTRVRIVAVCPGMTDTALYRNQIEQKGQPEDYVKFILSRPLQSADDAGKDTTTVFEKAESGTAWALTAKKPPKPVEGYEYISGNYIDSL